VVIRYAKLQGTLGDVFDPAAAVPTMHCLLRRNIVTDGYVLVVDPAEHRDPPGDPVYSQPGCIIASPSYPAEQNHAGGSLITQDYVYHWTRDAALVVLELIELDRTTGPSQQVIDYVRFSRRCQGDPTGDDFARAAFWIDGRPRDWSDQSDGPALQTLAVLRGWDRLDEDTRGVARDVVEANLRYLLRAYPNPTVDLWEMDHYHGMSLFTRSVQLRCLRTLRADAQGLGLADTPGLAGAVADLDAALRSDGHWDATGRTLISLVGAAPDGYEPNISSVLAALHGDLGCTGGRVLATAARLREAWLLSDDSRYPINAEDAGRGMGPLFGRFPGDTYDGNDDSSGVGHPWALCTAAIAQLCYTVAAALAGGRPVPDPSAPDPEAGREFFAQLGLGPVPTAEDAARLVEEGDRMLRAVVHHSDHYELSEQFDARTGYSRSVSNLTWSYAAYLSAVRARAAVPAPAGTG
jgi:glucoamylase